MNNHSKGDISVYIVIVVGMMILGSAVLLSLILARQISLTEDLVASERAFYVASTGTEEGFYRLALQIKKQGGSAAAPADIAQPDLSGSVTYDLNGVAHEGKYEGNISRVGSAVCGSATGRFMGEQRRIQIGPTNC